MYKIIQYISLACLLSFHLLACSLLPEQIDETKGWSAAKLYEEAKNDMANHSYDLAIKKLDKLEARFPFGLYAQQATIDLAYIYYKQGEQPQALATIEHFIKSYPNHQALDYMYYLRGLVNFNDRMSLLQSLAKQDMTERDPKAAREAFDAFQALATKFPDSKYTPDALLRMKYLVNAMAQYDLHVAKYYFRRGAYLAAANRAQLAITSYQDAPAMEEALYLLYQSYDKMGLIKLRDDTKRVFDKNYPHSAIAHPSAKKTAWWKFWSI